MSVSKRTSRAGEEKLLSGRRKPSERKQEVTYVRPHTSLRGLPCTLSAIDANAGLPPVATHRGEEHDLSLHVCKVAVVVASRRTPTNQPRNGIEAPLVNRRGRRANSK